MFLFHAVLVPTGREIIHIDNKKTFIKCSIKDSQNSFMLIGESWDDLEEVLFDKIDNPNPCIILIGQLFYSNEIYVYFMGIKYQVKKFAHALDVCLKIYKLFKIDYPLASTLAWTFIQRHFYKIVTPTDKQHSSIEILMKQFEKLRENVKM